MGVARDGTFFFFQGATLAAQIAAGINARVGFQKADNAPPSLPPELDSSANEKWEDEVEINDLPQQVRWKITSKVGIFFSCAWQDLYVSRILVRR